MICQKWGIPLFFKIGILNIIMESGNESKEVIEIRLFLRQNRDEDRELYKDFKEVMDKLYPIKACEIGKMLIKRGIDHWKQEIVEKK